MKRCLQTTLPAMCILAVGAAAQAPDESAPVSVERPKRSFLRYNEDWSSLRDIDRTQTGDFWDQLKFIPLNDSGDVWLSFGGHARVRYEHWNDFAFGAPVKDDDDFVLARMAVHADLHVGETFRAFVEAKSALATDRSLPGGRRGLDTDSMALEQAFIDIVLPFGDDAKLTLRPGRQVFSFGKQRLISPLPWANTLRRWDGVSAILEVNGWNIHGFWTQFAPVDKHGFNESDAQTQLYGVYATGKIPETSVGLDLYFLGLDRDNPIAFNGTVGNEERFTVGGRVFGKIGDSGFDYDLEGAYQFGEVGAGDISAFMIGSQLGFRPTDVWADPRFYLGFDYATGDDSPGGDVGTFNQLFPLGHAYYGYADFVGRQNAIDLSIGTTISPFKKFTFDVSSHFFWLAEETDALYNAGGIPIRAGLAGASDQIGVELDLTAKYKFDRHLAAQAGYSHFFAGDFISDTGADSDIDFFYLQFVYTF